MTSKGWGAYIKEARQKRRMTGSDLARATGINQSLISRWERDEVAPSVDTLRKVSSALNIPVLELMVAAGLIEPKEARMADRPAPPEPPVGAGVDPELLADAESLSPAEVQRVRDFIKGIRAN